jgi:hypothetical protein
MKKQKVKKTLDSNCLDELDGLTLCEASAYFLERAEKYETEGYTDVAFNLDYSYDDTSQLSIVGTRVETDDEAIARAVAAVRREKETRERDLQVLKQTAERLGINIENI